MIILSLLCCTPLLSTSAIKGSQRRSNGSSKKIEDDTWKANAFDLEEMYCQYLDSCRNVDTSDKSLKEQEGNAYGTMLKGAGGDKDVPVESLNKKKKKKKEENGENGISSLSEVQTIDSITELTDKKKKKAKLASESRDDNGIQQDSLAAATEKKREEESACGTMMKDAPVENVGKKKKKKKNEEDDENAKVSLSEVKIDDSTKEPTENKKKKIKLASEFYDQIMGSNDQKDFSETAKSKDKMKEQKLGVVFPVEDGNEGKKLAGIRSTDTAEISLDHDTTEPKEKKRRKKVSVNENIAVNGVEVFDKEKSEETLDNGTDKQSKKRKRSASDESKDKPVEVVALEESKRRKTDGPEKAKVQTQQVEVKTTEGADIHLGEGTEEENEKSPNQQFHRSEKGNPMSNGAGRSSDKKTSKRHLNGSAEAKTVNTFQRVKVDAVEFADERLQDNSYWAKEGAENGYGAKAQDVLGQVKGRGFRHEKTKKKRGSYRGGQIDLQSHSVKFDYSDDD